MVIAKHHGSPEKLYRSILATAAAIVAAIISTVVVAVLVLISAASISVAFSGLIAVTRIAVYRVGDATGQKYQCGAEHRQRQSLHRVPPRIEQLR